MHRFFVDAAGFTGDTACLEAGDARHARQVLRLAVGDRVELLDGQRRFLARIETLEETVRCRLLAPLPSTEAGLRITLFQGLPKGEKLELIIQKLTELGAAAVAPVAMRRCVSRLTPRDVEKKQARWQRIAREAAKQSGRTALLQVEPPTDLAGVLRRVGDFDAVLVPWEEARQGGLRQISRELPQARRLALVVGPEGGIDPAEADALERAGARLVTLGPRILRTETAGLAAAAALLALYGDMDTTVETEG